MKRTLIQNAVIVNEGRKVLGSVVIENEKIAEILVKKKQLPLVTKSLTQAGVISYRVPSTNMFISAIPA